MAEAIARGVVAANIVRKQDVQISDPLLDRRKVFANEIGTDVTDNNAELMKHAQTVLLAVKPQHCQDVLEPLSDAYDPEKTLLISIMAGVKSPKIINDIGGENVRIIRVMPNTPMLVGAGMAALCKAGTATDDDLEWALQLFGVAATTITVDESQMDAVTALSGSGPAYYYYFTEALISAGIKSGLYPDQAATLAKQTARGAALLMCESTESPETLRRKVTSPGGTTQAALESLQHDKVFDKIVKAVMAAEKRSKEMG